MSGGCYLLWIDLDSPLSFAAGRLGRCSLPAGLHVYAGSARRGLEARVLRHLSRRRPSHQALRRRVAAALDRAAPGVKRLRWHVDHLLERRAARVVAVDLFDAGSATECGLVASLLERGATAPIPRFGASDCRRCPAHLLRVEQDR